MTTPTHNGHADRAPLPKINYAALADALLSRADTLVPQWLSGGVMRGREYFVHSPWRSEKTASLSICMSGENAGKWSDHGGSDRGGDLLSLYKAVHGLPDMAAAAVDVAHKYGLESVGNVVTPRPGTAPVYQLPEPAPAKPRKAEPEGWQTVTPVPESAPAPTFKHQFRTAADIQHNARYEVDGALYGFVIRFKKSDGGKETLPYTWCTSARDGASKWHWRSWDGVRPLYYPNHQSPGTRTVVVVEGERKADVLQALLDQIAPNIYTVCGWVGGCKAWDKAAWDWLTGCNVLLWPDCDGKREPLTKAQADQYVDTVALELAKANKPLLPAHKQGGMKAMLGIGALLRDAHGCTVQLLAIPEPLAVEDGWDCADAIEKDGWDGEHVLQFFGTAYALPVGDGSAPVAAAGGSGNGKKIDRPVETGGSDDDGMVPPGGKLHYGDDAFNDYLLDCVELLKLKGVYELGVNRNFVIKALRKSPHLQGCLGLNELTGAPSTQKPWPWRTEDGPLKDTDDLMLGDWLCTTYKIKPAGRGALSEAIDTIADQNRFHPIRDWVKTIHHDGKPRLDKWLIHVMGLEPEKLKPKRRKYLEMVGRFLLMGLVARAVDPGCKFDYSPVFEGLAGRGKSTLIRVLVGDTFFSDTHFDIGTGKDGFEQLGGIWGYELSELTSLRKADSEMVKQFFSSQIDRYRGAYGKYVQAHPRQCVIFCSTNKKHYLYDMTGNRRFWPVWIERYLNLKFVAKWREQLFAEAYARYAAGEAYTPTPEEEKIYFEPEQRLRMSETAVQSKLFDLLTRNGVPVIDGKQTADLNQLTMFVTLDRLVSALGTDAGKSGTLLENQIKGWLESNGWMFKREGGGQRRYGYAQPKVWPPKIDDEEEDLVHENTQALREPIAQVVPIDPAAQAGTTEDGNDDAF